MSLLEARLFDELTIYQHRVIFVKDGLKTAPNQEPALELTGRAAPSVRHITMSTFLTQEEIL